MTTNTSIVHNQLIMKINFFAILWPISIAAFIALLYLWVTYNSLIKKRNQVRTDISDINVQLKRKAELIETLVSMVREYTKHESKTFTEVSKARSAIDTSKNIKDTSKAENMLTDTLKSLFAVAEDYPELKASNNYQELRVDIKETENFIARYREEYNKSVQTFNNTTQVFPTVLIASMLGFEEQEFFGSSTKEA